MIHPLLLGIDRSKLEVEQLNDLETFEREPQGRKFLPVVEILKIYGLHHQALELLMQGVHLHPDMSIARIQLAVDLFQQGLFRHCWKILQQSVTSLVQNPTALKLCWKLSILLGYEQQALEYGQNIAMLRLQDKDITEKCTLVTSGFFKQVQFELRSQLKNEQIPLEDLDELAPLQKAFTHRERSWEGFSNVNLQEVFRFEKIDKKLALHGVQLDQDDLGEQILNRIGLKSVDMATVPEKSGARFHKKNDNEIRFYQGLLDSLSERNEKRA